MFKNVLIVAMLVLAAVVGLSGAFGTWAADSALAEPACRLVSGTCDPFWVNRFTGCSIVILMAFGLLLMTFGKFQRTQ